MKFINIDFPASKEEVLAMLSNNEKVNANVRFEEGKGKPLMKIKENNGKIRITCEMIGRASKDNGFLVGTYFKGRIIEHNGVTKLRGSIWTAPIYHLVFILMLVVFIFKCIEAKGFSVLPVFLVVFDILLFKDEYKKQGFIKRYLNRAQRKFPEKT